jgi:hypothetical protein
MLLDILWKGILVCKKGSEKQLKNMSGKKREYN